jgi:hypothetical protein
LASPVFKYSLYGVIVKQFIIFAVFIAFGFFALAVGSYEDLAAPLFFAFSAVPMYFALRFWSRARIWSARFFDDRVELLDRSLRRTIGYSDIEKVFQVSRGTKRISCGLKLKSDEKGFWVGNPTNRKLNTDL